MMIKIREVIKNHYSFNDHKRTREYVKTLLRKNVFLSVDEIDMSFFVWIDIVVDTTTKSIIENVF